MARILIVDDSETLRGQVKSDLVLAGYETLEAADGINGLEVFSANSGNINLILCDVNMPRLDGLSMISKLFESNGGKIPPVFMLTTECSPEMKSKGKSVGVVAWITKPYAKEKLTLAVAKALEKFKT